MASSTSRMSTPRRNPRVARLTAMNSGSSASAGRRWYRPIARSRNAFRLMSPPPAEELDSDQSRARDANRVIRLEHWETRDNHMHGCRNEAMKARRKENAPSQVDPSEKLLRQLIRETLDLVFIKDREGRYLVANPASALVA